MLAVLKELFASKKFIVMLAAVVVAIASKLGLAIDQDVSAQVIALAGAYVVGQGIADHGKEAAKVVIAAQVKSDNNTSMLVMPAPTAPPAPTTLVS